MLVRRHRIHCNAISIDVDREAQCYLTLADEEFNDVNGFILKGLGLLNNLRNRPKLEFDSRRRNIVFSFSVCVNML